MWSQGRPDKLFTCHIQGVESVWKGKKLAECKNSKALRVFNYFTREGGISTIMENSIDELKKS